VIESIVSCTTTREVNSECSKLSGHCTAFTVRTACGLHGRVCGETADLYCFHPSELYIIVVRCACALQLEGVIFILQTGKFVTQ